MVGEYINNLKQELITGNALEHSYRPALKKLIESLNNSIRAVNEPSRSEYGAPDFIFLNKNNSNLILGYAETKDINTNLDQIEKSEQIKRYLGYSNLFLTNYLEFRFFKNGEKYQTINIAKKEGNHLITIEENLRFLERELQAFLEGRPETITNAVRLAKIMGGKAARIRENVNKYLKIENDKNQELLRIFKAMQDLLIHDLSIEKFADMYSQTLVYGLFVARYYDETPENFSRQEARDLIPASNPFLQHFFDHIVGPNFDKRLQYIVDELCNVFAVSAVRETISMHYNLFGEAIDKDPVIHFYEDFLKEYDADLRREMGAYYTPIPVVHFIINAVNFLLKKKFNLQNGLADTTRVEQRVMLQGTKVKQVLHKVQILDPAVGTATFLNETVKYIYKQFSGQEGLWESYVKRELLPRLHGFELMMAPYTIAHLKLAMTFKETGINQFDHRLGVYLTNTLEEGVKAEETLFGIGFGQTITEESEQASNIKNNKPIMVIMGNPPYNPSSSNKGNWILDLIKVYKQGLEEQNFNSLSDDYIKFIRISEHFIEKNKSGIIAMITNNSFIDGITFRNMRKHLLQTFDDIYVIDLHGNSKKKEKAPDGSKDENVFDIQQGVSISVFVRKDGSKKGLGNVYHTELFGTRNHKFDQLNINTIDSIKWNKLDLTDPYYFFVPKDFSLENEYSKGFKLNQLFSVFGSGIKFRKDNLLIRKHFTRESVESLLDDMNNLENDKLYIKYDFNNTSDWTLDEKKHFFKYEDLNNILPVLYRPFDIRYTYYPIDSIANLIPRGDSRKMLMQNMHKENIALLAGRQVKNNQINHFFVTNLMSEMKTAESSTVSYHFPLYIYDSFGTKNSNLNQEVVKKIEKVVSSVSPEEIFDYIYAVLFSNEYKNRYKEFLKIDFPIIPYPKDKSKFRLLIEIGSKLRKMHLLNAEDLNFLSTIYPVQGDNLIESVEYRNDKVYINNTQYFGNIPKEVWEYYIGGYPVAQKWLTSRVGRKLEYDEIMYYQKVISSIQKTIELVHDLDNLEIL